MKLTFELLRSTNYRRCEEVFHKIDDWSPTDWACAMAGECGEACNEVKKLKRLEIADVDLDSAKMRVKLKQKIGSELADLVIYADLLATRLDLSLGEEVVRKFNQVSRKRKSLNFL